MMGSPNVKKHENVAYRECHAKRLAIRKRKSERSR